MIDARLDLRFAPGDFALAVHDDAEVQVLGLFGPSGSGKTTLLETLAGLRRRRRRHPRRRPQLLDTAAGIDVPPRRRRVGYVPQDALFPALDRRREPRLRRRAATAARASKSSPRCSRSRNLLERPTADLSGGERQRVALAARWSPRPTCCCSTSRSGALDPARRERILPYVMRARQALGVPMVWGPPSACRS